MERILYGKPIAEELDAKSKLIFTNFENANDRKPKLTAITVGDNPASLLYVSRKEEKFSGIDKYIYCLIGFIILVISEITVRFSGNSINHTIIYYSIPIGLLPIIYLFLLRTFKYENLY